MQYFLAKQPPYYFTHLPKTTADFSHFCNRTALNPRTMPSSARFTETTQQSMAWSGLSRVATASRQVSDTPYRPRHTLLAILTVIGLALPIIYYSLSPTGTRTGFASDNANTSLININPSLTATSPDTDNIYQKIVAQKVLKLAIVDSPTLPTDEKIDGSIDPHFIQSYGRALAQRLASHLGAKLEVARYSSQAQAQNAIVTGQADMLMTAPAVTPSLGLIKADYNPTTFGDTTNASAHAVSPTAVATVNVACHSTSSISQPMLTWQMKHSTDKFANRVQDFLCDHKAQNDTLWQFYTQNTLQQNFNQDHFDETVSSTLPRLKPIFQQNAQAYHHDWKMLAAVAYQESHLQSNAVSPTGVRGIMMLTNDTAKAMGVSNRTDPAQSIKGGAKYLEMLQSQFSDVPESERLWFTLAAYNMGPMAVTAIQDKLRQGGKDANSWAEVYHYMLVNKKYTPRYTQCLDYVSNIHGYLTLLNQSPPTPGALVTQNV